METYRKSLNPVFLFRMRTATLMTALCVFMLAAGAANAVTYTDSSPQTTAGQNFIFTFSPVNLWSGGNGTFTVHARGDYSVDTSSEYLDWNIDGLVSDRAAPLAGGTVIQTFEYNDIEWEQSFTVSGGLLDAITSDSSIAISIDLSSGVNFEIDPSKHFVEVELTYNASGPQCLPPAEPSNPDPCDGAIEVQIDTCLSWNGSVIPPTPGNIVINEINMSSSDWLELFNPTGSPVDLTGWQVIARDGRGYVATFTIPAFVLDPGAYVVLHEDSGTNTSTNLYFSQNIMWITNASGSCALVDAGGVGVDFVRWSNSTGMTPSTDQPPAGTNWTGNDPWAPSNQNVNTLGRDVVSTDTDDGSDWENTCGVDASGKTPGAANIGGATAAPSAGEPQFDIDQTSESIPPPQMEDPESTMSSSPASGAGSIGSYQVNLSGINVGDMIGIDFDAGSGSPANWNYTTGGTAPIVLANLLREDGTSSSVIATLASAGSGFDNYVTAPDPTTVPIHTPSLVAVGDYFWHGDQLTWTFTISNLVAGEAYNVYVFGLRGFEMNNDITISGGLPPIHFIQSDPTGGHLWVNAEIGDNGRELDSFAEVMTATLSSEIVITVDSITNSQTIAGISIEPVQQHCPTTWDVYLGKDSSVLGLVAGNLTEPNYCPGGLETGETYFWQVIAKNPSGETPGNVWSFETEGGDPPECHNAVPSVAEIFPPRHEWVDIEILNVTDPDGDPVSITITGITQDEPVAGRGSGRTSPDGMGVGTSVAHVRAERSGQSGNGRVYEISFEADDGTGNTCNGSVKVCVPHDQGQGHECVDDGQLYDSIATEMFRADLNDDGIINLLDYNILLHYWLVSYELED